MTRTNQRNLNKRFPGRPVMRLMGHIIAVHDHELAPLGITARQMALMAACEEMEACTPVELARLEGIEVSSVTRMVERLVGKGLMTRTHSEEDRRQVALSVTEKGAQLLEQALQRAARNSAAIWQGVTEKELAALRSIVEKLDRNLETLGPKHPKMGSLNGTEKDEDEH